MVPHIDPIAAPATNPTNAVTSKSIIVVTKFAAKSIFPFAPLHTSSKNAESNKPNPYPTFHTYGCMSIARTGIIVKIDK